VRIESIRLSELRDERRALALAAGNIFATPEFHETWWRHAGAGRELALRAAWDGSRLAAVWPAYVWRRAPRIERFLGHGGGDELGPCGEAAAFEALRSDALVLAEHVPTVTAGVLGVREVLAEQSPVLAIDSFAGWDPYLATRSANFRQQVRSRTRRLEREHDVVFRLATAATLDADLDTLFRLHRARWPKGSEFARKEAFHRDFARVALDAGWNRLTVLELDGKPAAAWYGFRFGEVDSYYQSGRDPAHERDSVGLVLLAATIRSAFEQRQREYRFLRGDEPYKARFTDDPGSVISGFAGRGADALSTAARAARVSQAAARRLARSPLRARRGRASRQGA